MMNSILKKLNEYPESQRFWIKKNILEFVLKKSYEQIIASNFQITKDQGEKILNLIDQNLKHNKPWEYIFGKVDFLDLSLKIKEPILIPRPETEELVQNFINFFSKFKDQNLKILDIGTGSGCIAISIAHHFKNFDVLGVDILDKAIELAKENAKLNQVENIKFIKSNLFESLDQKFDIIISNPPYISHQDYESLEPNVKNWESKLALVADNYGMQIIKNIVDQSKTFLYSKSELKEYPRLLFEIGLDQKDLVLRLKNDFFDNVEVKKDIFGKDRFAYFFAK